MSANMRLTLVSLCDHSYHINGVMLIAVPGLICLDFLFQLLKIFLF